MQNSHTKESKNNEQNKNSEETELEMYYPSKEELKKSYFKKFTKNLIFCKT
jgi:hypothetical protein